MKVVTFEFVDYHGRKTTTAEKHLEILFRLSNASQTAKLYYRSWRGHTYDMMAHTYNGATLKDNLGNTYKLVPGSNCDSRPSNNSVDKTASINPGKAIVATLVFEVPVESARTLTQLCGSTEFHAFRYHPKLHHSQTRELVVEPDDPFRYQDLQQYLNTRRGGGIKEAIATQIRMVSFFRRHTARLPRAR